MTKYDYSKRNGFKNRVFLNLRYISRNNRTNFYKIGSEIRGF